MHTSLKLHIGVSARPRPFQLKTRCGPSCIWMQSYAFRKCTLSRSYGVNALKKLTTEICWIVLFTESPYAYQAKATPVREAQTFPIEEIVRFILYVDSELCNLKDYVEARPRRRMLETVSRSLLDFHVY